MQAATELNRIAMKSGSLAPLYLTFAVLILIAIGLTLWLYYGDSFRTAPPPQAVVNLNKEFEAANEYNAEIATRLVKDDGIVALSIERFRAGMRRFPYSLREMQEKPEFIATGERWSGPYINNPEFLIDPWGTPYQYSSPGMHNESTYDLWSNGPDKLTGTIDDIGNWQ